MNSGEQRREGNAEGEQGKHPERPLQQAAAAPCRREQQPSAASMKCPSDPD